MNYDIDAGNASNNTVNLQLAEQFITSWNTIVANDPMRRNKAITVDSKTFAAEYSEFKNKAITGASAATGNALVGQNFAPVDMSLVAIELGNVFVESGFRYQTNVAGTYTFPAFQNFGDFAVSTSGSAQTIDIASNVGVNNPINPALYQAEIPLYQDPAITDYVNNRGALFALFEQVLEIKKGVLADKLVVSALAANPTGITTRAASGATSFPLMTEIMFLVSELSRFGTPAVYVNRRGLMRILSEQDQLGNFSNAGLSGLGNGKFVYADNKGQIPRKGLVGYTMGAEVYIVPSIPNTLTVNPSNAITATTGGVNTLLAVGIPGMAGVVRGRAEDDFVTIYSPSNDRQAFREAQTSIGAYTYMGANILNPYGWGYYAFTA